MADNIVKKILAWLRGTAESEAQPANPADRATDPILPMAEFILSLAQEKLTPDYRELADLLWLERLVASESTMQRSPLPIQDTPQSKEGTPNLSETHAARNDQGEKEKRPRGISIYAPARQLVESERVPAVRVRLPAPSPLPDALQLGRAFRPFARRAKSAHLEILHEEATAEASAESGLLSLQWQASPERWYSVALVMEDVTSMSVWKQTAQELYDLLRQHGTFEEVKFWRLGSDAGKPVLLDAADAQRPIRAIRGANLRQLVLLLTDGASSNWQDGTLAAVLDVWSRDCSVAIVQVLSERLWPRTPLGWPDAVVKAETPGAPNHTLRVQNPGANEGRQTLAPIIGLDPGMIAAWARMVMQPGAAYRAAVFSEADALEPLPKAYRAEETADQIPPNARIANFRALSSRQTRRLAIYLSVLPLTLPIMRLVQTALLRHPQQEQLSELLLGGIIQRITPLDSGASEDEIEYDFHPGVREILEKDILVDELQAVLGEVLSRGHAGKFELSALLPAEEGDDTLPATARSFAKFLVPALKRLGLEHLLKAGEDPSDDNNHPGTGEIEHQVFSFETVTLDKYGKEIERRALTARQFVEDLGEGVTLEMVEIPGGTFMMGSPKSEAGSSREERPQHEVSVAPFYIGKFTITQEQWRIVAGWPKVDRDLKENPSRFKGERNPVESISWDDAKEFCARLSQQTGRAYRLPTEAEWEYACRAGTTTPFAFGETITSKYVNYDGNYPYAEAKETGEGKYRQETIPVGSLEVANAFGLYDMHGNVWEWCEDLWHGSYEKAPIDGSARLSEADSSYRVLRGGSWINVGRLCRSALRVRYDPGIIYHNRGVRVVVSSRTLSP